MYSNSYGQEYDIDWVTCCHGLELLIEYFRSNTTARFEMPKWCASVHKVLTLNRYLHVYVISISSHISTREPRARFPSDMQPHPACFHKSRDIYCLCYNHMEGFVQDYSISSALVMEILQSYTKPSIYSNVIFTDTWRMKTSYTFANRKWLN